MQSRRIAPINHERIFPMQAQSGSTVDHDEIAKFSAMADAWWDPRGAFRPLHDLNPIRIGYIRDQIAAHWPERQQAQASTQPLTGIRMVDIGCGGGLLSEPLARMGATMLGIDASEKNIAIASTHAASSGIAVEYRATTAEDLAAQGAQFDVVCALEIIEHVANTDAFMAALSQLVRPGGLVFLSTLNRTIKSYGMAIIGAEYVLRMLPRGTHEWKKFIRPSELVQLQQRHGLTLKDQRGLVLNPWKWEWQLSAQDLDVNYMQVATRS
jgi:2-polyprenyl-6-hydroxyphenyl methylase / 3-demethylubiquinone-9 3-methyltransferase